jgi:hypothetical protein
VIRCLLAEFGGVVPDVLRLEQPATASAAANTAKQLVPRLGLTPTTPNDRQRMPGLLPRGATHRRPMGYPNGTSVTLVTKYLKA